MVTVICYSNRMKAKYNRPTTQVRCAWCSVMFEKDNRFYNRTEREGKDHCCSEDCGRLNGHKNARPLRQYVSACKKTAKSRGIAFDLDLEFLEGMFESQGHRCAISGVPIHLRYGHRVGHKKSLSHASIDRIDNDLGYVKSNVQFVALGVNYMRNTMSVDEAKDFIDVLVSSKVV